MVFLGVIEPTTLDTLAFHEALVLVEDLYLPRVVVACDCKPIVDNIKEGIEGPYITVIREIVADNTLHDLRCYL